MVYNDLRRGRCSILGQEYFITGVVAGRRAVFSDFACARLMVASLRGIQQDGYGEWLAWVVMPDHFHGLFRLTAGTLPESMQKLLGRSARVINRHLEISGRLWQPGYYDHALRQEDDRIAIARYIVANPLRKGLTGGLGDYPHWDSVWL